MATQIGKAFVQIVPSAKGLGKAISDVIDHPSKQAGVSAGSGMGGSIVGALKGALIAAGVGKLMKDTIMQGGALEQSIGGIETLFKGSAGKVIAAANEAYKTAGMSANEYMEMTTGFSASLLQSVAGDTDKAADIAGMAMTDMSDNANKMGTNMEDIKNAYQGFAKQNYTMLDNLKLGYGGTKTEMQRLLADAEKITGVKYDINNLADVYSAIHVIQGELDITGTTAKEASTTLQGSFAAMAAAGKNVMGQLALGKDVGPALKGLADTVVTFLVGNLIPAIWNILSGLPGALFVFVQAIGQRITQGIGSSTDLSGWVTSMVGKGAEMINGLIQSIFSALPSLIQTARDMVLGFISGIGETWPTLLAQGTAIINSVVTGILDNLPAVANAAMDIMQGFLSMVSANLPAIVSSGIDILLNLINGIIRNLPQLAATAVRLMTMLITNLLQMMPGILQAGIEGTAKLAAGLIRAIPSLLAQLPQIVYAIVNFFASTDWGSIGWNIIRGIASGLRNAGGMLWDAVRGVLGSFKDNVLAFFGIHSPARWGVYVGQMIDTGIAGGLTGYSGLINRAIDDVTGAATSGAQAVLRFQPAGVSRSDNQSRVLEALSTVTDLLYRIVEKDSTVSMYLNDREIGRARLGGVYG